MSRCGYRTFTTGSGVSRKARPVSRDRCQSIRLARDRQHKETVKTPKETQKKNPQLAAEGRSSKTMSCSRDSIRFTASQQRTDGHHSMTGGAYVCA